MVNNKGAMFGLDARIALAIFGALSVISGAALYSAIKDARATALLTEMKEIGKSWEQYYLDTGEKLEQYSNNPSDWNFLYLRIGDTIDNGLSKPGWKGPYLNYELRNAYSLWHEKYYAVYILLLNDKTWDDYPTLGKCSSGDDCFNYITLSGFDDGSLAKDIDSKVDGGDGDSSGLFRWGDSTDANIKYRYYLRISPSKNPN